MYVLAVTCAAGLPSVVPGNGAVVDVSRSAIDGNKYYFKITAKGQVGESTGIYINGSKISTFVVTITSTCISDTTMPMQLKVGECYKIGLTSQVRNRWYCLYGRCVLRWQREMACASCGL